MSNLAFCTILSTLSSSSSGFSRSSASRSVICVTRLAAEIEPVAHAMAERHIGRRARAERERDADQLALHGIGRRQLRAEGDMALVARCVEQRGEPLRIGHRLVVAAIEGERAELAARSSARRGRAFLVRIGSLGTLGNELSAGCANGWS